MKKKDAKKLWKKTWHFIWEEDSIASWIVNVLLAFVLIKFLVYPGLGFLLGTSYPVVAVVSGSMVHDSDFNDFWAIHHSFYENQKISKEEFQTFPFQNGFNKGDIMVLYSPKDIQVGDVIVFMQKKPDPIIHRVVKKWDVSNIAHFQTKGDHNYNSISSSEINELDVPQNYVLGKAVLRIPYLGWVKIAFVELINYVRGIL